MYKKGTEILHLFESIHIKTKSQKFYKMLSNWESYIIGHIINNQEKDIGFGLLYDEMHAEITEFLKFAGYNDRETNHIKNDDNECELFLEFTGLVKVIGFPAVNSAAGMESLRKRQKDRGYVDPKMADQMCGMFKKIFCMNYRKKEGKYSNHAPLPQNHTQKILNKHIPHSIEKQVSLMEWNQITFKKTFEFDYHLDPTTVLKDTACAPPGYKAAGLYDPCAYKNLYNVEKPKVDKIT